MAQDDDNQHTGNLSDLIPSVPSPRKCGRATSGLDPADRTFWHGANGTEVSNVWSTPYVGLGRD